MDVNPVDRSSANPAPEASREVQREEQQKVQDEKAAERSEENKEVEARREEGKGDKVDVEA